MSKKESKVEKSPKSPPVKLGQGEKIQIIAGDVSLLISRHHASDDVHLHIDPKSTLFEVAIIPRPLKSFVLRAIQRVM